MDNSRTGHYITKKVTGESFKAYVLALLSPEPPIDLTGLYPSYYNLLQEVRFGRGRTAV